MLLLSIAFNFCWYVVEANYWGNIIPMVVFAMESMPTSRLPSSWQVSWLRLARHWVNRSLAGGAVSLVLCVSRSTWGDDSQIFLYCCSMICTIRQNKSTSGKSGKSLLFFWKNHSFSWTIGKATFYLFFSKKKKRVKATSRI